MKIFSAVQIREWDEFTIAHEPISSIDLMERAAQACVKEILTLFPSPSCIFVLAGPGNNGGDGLAIARIFRDKGIHVIVYHPGGEQISGDNRTNLGRWKQTNGNVQPLDRYTGAGLPEGSLLIDAVFGTGQNRSPEGIYRDVINKVNASTATVISVDMPSGMIADAPSDPGAIIRASYTLTFQCMKLAFLLPATGPCCGEVRVLDIGLSREYHDRTETLYELTDADDIRKLLKPRPVFAHKGDFGTALLMAGKKGMMGAAILAARACFRSGVGKLVCRTPADGLEIMQTAVPEAICSKDPDPDHLAALPDLHGFQSVAIGPGIGTHPTTANMLALLMDTVEVPMVLDADALNIISENNWQEKLRKGMVITPHPGEFRRLAGAQTDDFARLEACSRLSTTREICVILKGHFTYLSTESGKRYFNSTGNPGMAKAGSGDVLTGVLAAFLAQKYSTDAASRLAVYFHGLAGDLAAKQVGETGLMPSDTIDLISVALDRVWHFQ